MIKKQFPKSWRRRITASVLGLSLSFGAFMAPAAMAANLDVDTSGIDNYNGGRLPAGLDASYYAYPQNTNGIMPYTVDNMPEKYDLRSDHEKTPVTSVKNQNPWGSCWAFGTTSSIESNAIVKGAGTANSIDYSEHYLAWFSFQPQNGEGYIVTEGAANALNFGGRRQMTTADTASWSGPVNEDLAPWQNAAGNLDAKGDWSLPASLMAQTPKADEVHVQNVDYLPETGVFTGTATGEDGRKYQTGYSFDAEALKAIKRSLMENGVLDVSYYSAKSLPGQTEHPTEIFNVNTHAQYSPRNVSANHEVSVVGWDDTYSADNFATKPVDEAGNPLNGAWIVKNSWGKGDGKPGSVDEEGYFYISYYDQTVSEFSAFQVDVPDASGLYSYDTNYQYDYLGIKSFANTSPSEANRNTKVANVFTAEKDSTLKAVSAVTVSPDTTVAIEIYRLPEGADISQAGEPVLTQTETADFGGYHTFDLKEGVELKAGERFAVAQSIVSADGKGYLPLEIGHEEEIEQGSGGKIKSVATIEPGQSYIADKQEDESYVWEDVADTPDSEGLHYGNVMIKAFTVDQDDAVTAALTVESLDGQKQSLGSQEVTDFTSPVLLPEGTEYIRLSATAQNGTASLSVAENTEIARADFQKAGAIVLSLDSEPRGNNPAEYPLSFNVQQILVSGDGVATLTDNQGLLPEGTTFEAEALTEGDTYKQAEKALKDGHSDFTLYAVKTLDKDSKPVVLASGKTLTMDFALPEGYDAARTKVYTIGDDSSLKDMNASVKAPETQAALLRTAQTAEAKTVLSVDTSVLNGTYAIAVVKDAAPGGGETPQGSGTVETKHAEATAQPGVLTGLTSVSNIGLPIAILVLVIVIAGVWFYVRKKNQ